MNDVVEATVEVEVGMTAVEAATCSVKMVVKAEQSSGDIAHRGRIVRGHLQGHAWHGRRR
jgi:hypothetical protein